MLETSPLKQMTLDEAIACQFRLVDVIRRHVRGADVLSAGDYGVVPGLERPRFTAMVEAVLAEFFGAEDCTLVRGAGTGALRSAFMAVLNPGDALVVHDAPLYPTTMVTSRAMGLRLQRCDYNRLDAEDVPAAAGALVQHARQKLEDRYDAGAVIGRLKSSRAGAIVIADDNYVVMRVPRMGTQLGADLSCFSVFKLLGPEGVGCIVGRGDLVRRIRADQYSGGSQVQGPEALRAIKQLVYAPVALAVQAMTVDEVVRRLNSGEVPGVRSAAAANAQSRVAIVELETPVAPRVIEIAPAFGAASHPVGADSYHEVAPMFYRLSSTFLRGSPELAERCVRINPMRAGAETVLKILRLSVDEACGRRPPGS